jgi:hypothetical protein
MTLNRVVLIFSLALLLCVSLVAQTTGTLRGTVYDPSGALVPKATVTATGPNNLVKVAETDDNGTFSFAGLPAGKYTVRVMAAGFTLVEKTDLDLSAGRALVFDAKLSVEMEKQVVTVADTQQVETDPSKNAGALILKEADLDMLSDDPDDLQADLLALAGPAAGPNGGQIFIDGFSGGQLPPKDSIREIRINANPFSAEYDTQGHGRIEIFTKPGSDKYHGSVNINYSDWIFNARNPFFTTSGIPIPASDTKNLMANFGGKLYKKSSFFIDFNRRQQREAAAINAVVLDSAFRPVTLAFGLVEPNTSTSISPRVDYQLTTNITLQGRYSFNKRDSQFAGVKDQRLPSTGTVDNNTSHTVQLTETWIANAKTVNETRFQYFRRNSNTSGLNPVLNISVAGAFSDGSDAVLNYANNSTYEFQNYTSITHGPHFVKFGVRFREYQNSSFTTNNFLGQFNFSSIDAYTIMQQGIAQHLPLATILASGGGPTQFSINAGNPLIEPSQFDTSLFVQDDWRVRPSMTLSLGLRYEAQTNIGEKGNIAPRVGFAWGIGPGQGRLRQPKMVLRAGAGFFYDRFSIGNVLNADRFNGTNQLAYTVTNPTFYPAAGVPIPALSTLPTVSSATYHIQEGLHIPTLLQTALSLERQLPKNISVSVNYLNTRGMHQLRTVNINTPYLGTYSGPGTGVYPLGAAAGIYQLYSSSGIFKQQQLIINANARVSSRITLFGYYAYGHVNSDVAGQPSNPYNFAADYGRASYDVRHRVNINGSLVLPFGLRVSPNIGVSSAPPFNVTQGIDQFGNSQYNTRPALAPAGFSAPTCTTKIAQSFATCMMQTRLGNFIINPPAGLNAIPINYFEGYGRLDVNARISRTWGFGEKATTQNQAQAGGPDGQRGPGFGQAAGGGGPRGAGGPGGGGPRGGGGGPGGGGPRGGGGPGGRGGGGGESGKKYSLTLGIFFHNLINTVNPSAPDGNLLSPKFGESRSIGGGGFGGFDRGGGGASAFNRRIDLSLRFSF